jgi:hypothetical protein
MDGKIRRLRPYALLAMIVAVWSFATLWRPAPALLAVQQAKSSENWETACSNQNVLETVFLGPSTFRLVSESEFRLKFT